MIFDRVEVHLSTNPAALLSKETPHFSTMELQVPSLLAQLPRPLGGSAGKCQLGEVYGLEGAKKRKRCEVAAAIDGESVNIYNVQFPKLVTSYAIPPQSSFSCAPCSVRQKPTQKNAVARRQTYCAIEQPENQIKCFLDESTTGAHNALNISNTSFKFKDSKSPVVFLGIIPTTLAAENQQDPFDVLVVHKDGRVRRLSADLKSQKWNVLPSTGMDQSSAYEIQAGFLVPFDDDARKSLFKKRQDLVALVLGDEIGTQSPTSSALILVSRPHQKEKLLPSDIEVKVFSVPTRFAEDDFSTSHTKRLRHLMTVTLPNFEEQQIPLEPQSHWNFNPSTSGLSLSFKNGFITYDISQYSPEISSHMILPNESFSSILRISAQSVIGAGKSSIAIYNTRYQSIQADLSLADISTAAATKLDEDKAPIVFISYFSKLGIAIATRGTALLGFDISSSHDRYDASLKQSDDGLLINAIGKGIQSTSDSVLKRDTKRANHMRPMGLSEPGEAAQWAELRKQLDALAEANEAAKFDQIVKDSLCKSSVQAEDDKSKRLPSLSEFVDPDKTSFLLRKIFSLKICDTEPKTSKLVVSFMPQKTFRWLINSHQLSLNNIRTALRQPMRAKMVLPIPSGSLVQALTESGRSISLLLQLLRSPTNLDATELSHALKILLDIARSYQRRPEEELPKAITESRPPAKERITQDIPHENQSNPSTTPRCIDTLITDTITGLNLTLTKLHSHPIDKTTQAIRSVLSNSDTLSIIHHLRHSLATGGYTSRFTEQSEAPFSSDPKIPTLSLPTIVHLLTACIDATGPGGWISAAAFAGAEDNETNLIADMKSEISAALVGVEEATYLKGILREFVRYADTATAGASGNNSSNNSNNKEEQIDSTTPAVPRGSRLKRKERHNGADILIYETHNANVNEGALNSDTQMLPLSLKQVEVGGSASGDVAGCTMVREEVSRTKIRKTTGEVVTRTEREIGYLRRKAVGKYSFERIVV
ncbi:hypothetical protein AJ78_01702 [Emergomyces pasteurianus Ep9510]|uniref:Utp8 beta-propeller domain-containing protein n=1 Tax=Emergomyces pasteurianus Ep9510 TaxID=1447872 RepID=A0A1J9QQ06_9EURO|nr:hypothetical protein AJ78_01702 [Emergomyces pasteurianus Ep9510]